jgi:hypothetical protein
MRSSEVKQIFSAKSRRRKELSKLSFKEKIRILIQVQRIAKGIRKDLKFKVWKIERKKLGTRT